MTDRYRKTSHGIYECKYHICWIPKYRYPILTEQVALRVRELVRQIAAANEVEIITGSVSSDHVHIYVSIPPSLSVSKFVQFIKGATSRKLQLEFENIRKRYWGQHVWARVVHAHLRALGIVWARVARQHILHGTHTGGVRLGGGSPTGCAATGCARFFECGAATLGPAGGDDASCHDPVGQQLKSPPPAAVRGRTARSGPGAASPRPPGPW